MIFRMELLASRIHLASVDKEIFVEAPDLLTAIRKCVRNCYFLKKYNRHNIQIFIFTKNGRKMQAHYERNIVYDNGNPIRISKIEIEKTY